MIENCERIFVKAPCLVDYQVYGNKNADKVALLLHGFGQNSEMILEDLKATLSEDYYWIIPNGVFPMPKKRKDSISYRFAWYFYNNIEEKYYIDFYYPSQVLKSLIKELDPKERPLTIIGYSQGGYLAPFAGQEISTCEKVIGINCNYRFDMLEGSINYALYALHGDKDPIVDYENSKNSFEQLRPKIEQGDYLTIKDGTHEIDDNIRMEISKLLS